MLRDPKDVAKEVYDVMKRDQILRQESPKPGNVICADRAAVIAEAKRVVELFYKNQPGQGIHRPAFPETTGRDILGALDNIVEGK